MVCKVRPAPDSKASISVRPSTSVDLQEYARWAAAIHQQDSTIDTDGLLSATHSASSMLSRFADGANLISVGFNTQTDVSLDELIFVEYRESGRLTGLLIADATSSPTLIHRVLVLPDYRSSGSMRPAPSIMSQLGHALIDCVGANNHVECKLVDLACVVAHAAKWTHIFETYKESRAARGLSAGITEIIPSKDPKISPTFCWRGPNQRQS